MPLYSLIFHNDGLGEARRVEFKAESSAKALSVARMEGPLRSFDIFREDERLGRAIRIPVGEGEIWQIR